MNSPVLIAALVVPLIGAVAALLVPAGRARREKPSRRHRRRQATNGEGITEGADDDTVAGHPTPGGGVPASSPTGDSPPVPAPPDLAAVERAGLTSRTLVRVAALVAAALWVGVALLGPSSAGPLRAIGPIAPAAAGAALVLAAVGRPARRLPAAAAGAALTLATGGLALGARDGGAGLAITAIAAAAVVLVWANRRESDGNLAPGALALAGTAVLAGGMVRIAADTGELNLPVDGSMPLDAGLLLVGGSAMVAAAASLRPRRAVGLLLPIALAVGVPAAAVLGDAGEAAAVVLMLLATASAVIWAVGPRSPRSDVRPLVGSLALASLAAAAVPTTGVPGSGATVAGVQAAGLPAAWLLAAAAVITAVALVPVASLSAVPGAAALAVVLIADPEPIHLMLVALAVAATIAGAVAVHRPFLRASHDEDDPQPAAVLDPLLAAIPALGAGVWLVVDPESWSWVGEVNLLGWTDTVAVAAAGGLIFSVAGLATGRMAVPGLPRLAGPDPVPVTDDPPRNARLALAAGVALGMVLVALLVSSSGGS